MTYIGEGAFCINRLSSINVDVNNTSFSSENGVLFNKSKSELISFPTEKNGSYTIPNTITNIGSFAFYNCNIQTINIPASVTTIGNEAFIYSDITDINVDNNNLSFSSNEGVLFNKNKTTLIYYPSRNYRTSYIVPNTVTSIASKAFYNCYYLTEVNLPIGVSSIGNYAFAFCNKLNKIVIPSSVTYIEVSSFYSSANLKFYTDCQSYAARYASQKGISTVLSHQGAGDWVIEKEPNCINEGSKYQLCSLCSAKVYEAIPAKNPDIGHEFGEKTILSVSTCSQNGISERICKTCGYIEYINLPTLPHTFKYNGDKTTTCVLCNQHKTFDFVVTTDETITLSFDALREFDFVVSDTSIAKVSSVSNSIISSGSYYKQVSNATIVPVKPGETTVKVVASNGTLLATSSLLVVEGSHQFVYVSTTKKATCEETGETLYRCKFCDLEETRTVSSLGHINSDWIIDIEATCTESGSKHKECTVCDKILETETISAKSHVAGNWIVDVQPTTTVMGSKHKECTVCGKVLETATIAKIPVTPTTKATSTFNGIQISWNTVSSATKYVVFRRNAGSSVWNAIGTTTNASFVDKNVSAGKYYIYSVRAYNAEGSYSAYVGAKTKTIQYILTPTAVATNLTNGVQIKWNSVVGATKYNVYRRVGGSSSWVLVGTTTGTSLVDKNVKIGTYYVYSIRAINGTGYSVFDTKKTDTIQPITAPTVKVVNKSNGVHVSWNAVPGATKYNVYRRLGGTSMWVYVGSATGTGGLDKGAVKGKSYAYSIRAINGTGYSAYNSTKCASIKHK